jgi:hypothetical protein
MKYLIFLFFIILSVVSYGQNTRYLTPSGMSISMSPSSASMTNTTTETTIFVDTIRANSMGLSKTLTLDAYGTITSLLTPPVVTIRIYVGSTVVAAFTSLIINASVTTAPFHINFVMTNNNNASSQFCYGEMRPNTAISFTSTAPYFSSSTINTSIDQYLKVTAQFGSAVTGTTVFPQFLKTTVQ